MIQEGLTHFLLNLCTNSAGLLKKESLIQKECPILKVIKGSEKLSLINFLFNKVLIHTTLNNDAYFNVAQAFRKEGLHFKVKNRSRNSFSLGQHSSGNDFTEPFINDFFVKKEDQYKAQAILSTLRR